MSLRVHSGEIHVLLIQIFDVVAYHFVVLFSRISRWTINRLPFQLLWDKIFTHRFSFYFAAICRTIEKWGVTILFAVQVTAQSENVAWRIFAHRHIGIRPDKDNTVTTITGHYHQQTGKRQFEHSPLHLIICKNECSCQ